jgi:hypothetical protein
MPDQHEQLEWEARAGRIAAGAAVVAALAPIVSGIALSAALPSRVHNDVQQVQALAHHPGAFWLSLVITAVGWLAFILPLLYLVRVARARIPVPTWVDPLVIIGPLLLVAALAVGLVDAASRAQDALPVTKAEARHLLRDVAPAVKGLGAAGALAVGAVFVLVSTYAGRAGLFSRFMTIIGAIIGGLTVLGALVGAASLGGPLVLFWGLALVALFIGRWPGGRGPAWETVEAIPWPTAQQRAALAQEEVEEEPEADAAEEAVVPAAQPNPRPARKRKKKKARR